MRPGRTILLLSLMLLSAARGVAEKDAVVITDCRYDGALVVASGVAPDDITSGDLAAAVDDDGHVLGILRTISSHADDHRLQALDVRWPHCLRSGLEVRWLDTEGDRGVVVWTDKWGAPLRVDGRDPVRLPAVLHIKAGSHELVAELAESVRAGATVTAPLKGETLLLRGTAKPEDPLLGESSKAPEDEPKVKARIVPDAVTRWIELPRLGRFYYPGGRVSRPKRVEEALPPYPERLLERGIEGWATLCAYVDTGGTAVAISRVAESRPIFARLGMAALRLFRFEPATLDDRPVPGTFTITMEWGLEPSAPEHKPGAPNGSAPD